MKSVYKFFAASLLSLSLLSGTSFAAPAWQLPAQGKVFTDEAKQIYIANQMGKFHSGQVELKFSAPDRWTYEKFSLGGVNVERLVNPKQKKSSRVVLQLHGGGYIGPLSDWYRDLAVKQAVLAEAREVYMVDYRTRRLGKHNRHWRFGRRKFGVGALGLSQAEASAAARRIDFDFAVGDLGE